MLRSWHKFARLIYKANRTTRTIEALESGSPRRIARLYERRMLYRLVARLTNRLFR